MGRRITWTTTTALGAGALALAGLTVPQTGCGILGGSSAPTCEATSTDPGPVQAPEFVMNAAPS